MSGFVPEKALSLRLYSRITDVRINEPERALAAAKARKRRKKLTARAEVDDGRLNLLAVDHPARLVTKVGDDPVRLADRRHLLARVLRIVVGGGVDGVMASMDILEELLILEQLVTEAGGPAFLEHKVLVASMNRGGLAGAAWELEDPLTGATAESCERWNLDGAKVLLRVSLDDPGSLRTLEVCARAVTELNARGLPMFLEPLVVRREGGAWRVSKSPEELARLVGVASALGDSSHRMWLKLPYTERFELPAGATTMPVLLLGGESAGDPTPLLREIHGGIATAYNVRGTLVGRNVLYPGELDPLVAARAVDGLVHSGWNLERAVNSLSEAAPPLQLPL